MYQKIFLNVYCLLFMFCSVLCFGNFQRMNIRVTNGKELSSTTCILFLEYFNEILEKIYKKEEHVMVIWVMTSCTSP
jgi:hypothetical protein